MGKKRTKYIIEVEKEVNNWDGWPVYRVVTNVKGPSDYLSADVVDSLKFYDDQNRNAESRIRTLTNELHKAQMEINRLVLENQEQDFEIHKLKKQRDELFERLVMNGFHECDYDSGEFLLKNHIDKDQEELHKTATTIIFGSPEERHEATKRAAENAAMIKRAMEEARQEMAEKVDILEGIFKNLER